jgi:ribosome-associated protein
MKINTIQQKTPLTTDIPAELQLIVDALDDKRGKDITVLDLREASSSLFYFVIATGESSLQLKAMQEEVKDRLKAEGYLPNAFEGPSELWQLMDYSGVVVHFMSPHGRAFYDLEGLWADAKRLDIVPN